MAFVNNPTTDEENQQQNGPVQLSSGSPDGTTKGGSGTGLTSVPTQPAAKGPSSSGNFTNIQTYLNANQTGANNLGNTLATNLNNAIGTANSTITDQGNQFNTAVTGGTDTYNPSVVKDATDDPVNFLNSPELTQLAAMKAGQYSGPSNFEGSTFANTAQTAQLNAQQQAALAGDSGGREQLLTESQTTPYTHGGLSLDQYLVQDTPTALNSVTNAAAPASNLTNLFNTTQTTGDANVLTGQNTSTATGQKTGAALNTALGDYRTNIDNAVTAAGTAQQTAQSNLDKAFTPTTNADKTQSYGNVTPADLQAAGLSQADWSQLVTLNNQAIAAGNPGINLDAYLTNTPGQFTEGSVATPQQSAYYNALSQIAGTGTPLNTGGTPGGSTYNTSGALNALLAELQAKAPTTLPTTASSGSNGASTVAAGTGIAGLVGQIANLLKPKATTTPQGPNTTQAGNDANTAANNIAAGTTVAPVIPPAFVPSTPPTPAGTVTVEPIENQPFQPNTNYTGATSGSVSPVAAGAATTALGSGIAAGVGSSVPTGIITVEPILEGAGDVAAGAGATAAGAGATEAGAATGALGGGASADAAGTAAIGAGTVAAVALPLAILAYAASTQPVAFGKQYWTNIANGLSQPKNTQAYQGASLELSALMDTNSGQIPSQILQLAQQMGIGPIPVSSNSPGTRGGYGAYAGNVKLN